MEGREGKLPGEVLGPGNLMLVVKRGCFGWFDMMFGNSRPPPDPPEVF